MQAAMFRRPCGFQQFVTRDGINSAPRQSRLLVQAAKKKRASNPGNRKAPRESPGQTSESGSPSKKSNEAPPRRITGAVHVRGGGAISFKRQLNAVRTYKQMAEENESGQMVRRESKPAMKTAFRKFKPLEGTEEYEQVRSARLASKIPLAALSLYGEDGSFIPPLLIVDGYNVVGAWPRLKKQKDAGNLDRARELLLKDLGAYIHYRGIEVICVFDAMEGNSPTTTTEKLQVGLEVAYPVNESADSFINVKVSELMSDKNRVSQVIVASGDNEVQRHAMGRGAHVCSSVMLIQDLKKAKKSTDEKIKELQIKARHGAQLEDALKPEVREILDTVVKEANEELKRRYRF